MSLKKLFGANVRRYRKAKGLRQMDLAEAASLSLEMIGRTERGLTGASFENIEKLSSILAVDPSVLFGADPATTTDDERGRQIQKILIQLSYLNAEELDRIRKMIEAYRG